MPSKFNLDRFIEAQERSYDIALSEIKNGRKINHWMWYIFPQPDGLGSSATSKKYAIKSLGEAKAYLQHPILGSRVLEISAALIHVQGRTVQEIFGSPDDLKLHSCMTLFAEVEPSEVIFQAILTKHFAGEKSAKTMKIIDNM